MKIIFDSNEQMEEFMRHGHCPQLIDYNAIEHQECEKTAGTDICIPCWENCGIEIDVKDDSTKLYKITLEGCDDETIFDMQFTNEEYELLKRVSEKANETSTYGCMPRMYIREVNPDESNDQD